MKRNRMKKLDRILNIIMGALLGAFVGRGMGTVWDYHTHPEQYVAQSAPWYTDILVYGLCTLIGVLSCMVIKTIIKRRQQ